MALRLKTLLVRLFRWADPQPVAPSWPEDLACGPLTGYRSISFEPCKVCVGVGAGAE